MVDGFQEVCQRATERVSSQRWDQTVKGFKKEVKQWVKVVKTPSAQLKEIEREMLALNSLDQALVPKWKEKDL